jgi:hypothetical protein
MGSKDEWDWGVIVGACVIRRGTLEVWFSRGLMKDECWRCKAEMKVEVLRLRLLECVG